MKIVTYILPFVGERRIRVHTLCLPVTNQLSEIYAGADQQAIIGLLAKMGKNTRIGQSTFSMYIIIYTCIMGVQEVYNEIKSFEFVCSCGQECQFVFVGC